MTQKPLYEKPMINRRVSGLSNKVTHVAPVPTQTTIDGVSVDELMETYGSPLFVFSERTIEATYQRLSDAFRRRLPSFKLAWSYKTNYLNAICQKFHQLGADAEVVSEFEYDKAVALGVNPEHIHFNGPYKPEPALEKAIRNGSHLHVDHFDEINRILKIAESIQTPAKVAIRMNMQVGSLPHWARFGFNLESGEAMEAIEVIARSPWIHLEGLHCHLGTFILDPLAYMELASRLSAFANEIRDRYQVVLNYLDLGGGFPSQNTLKGSYYPGTQTAPDFEAYAKSISEGLKTLDYPAELFPTIILETGRAMIDDAGSLLSTVHATKHLPDGRQGVILDAGVNTLFTSFWYHHDVVAASPIAGAPIPTVMFGPLCMNIDVVRETFDYPATRAGDKIMVRRVGAYNITQSMQFIVYRPAVVIVMKDGSHHLIKERENLEAVQHLEHMPEAFTPTHPNQPKPSTQA